MSTLLIVAMIWPLLSLALALVLGRIVAMRDEEE